jgi:hypothetical protein
VLSGDEGYVLGEPPCIHIGMRTMTLLETTQLLGNLGEFFGAIAVVVTLIFLTLQVRQNTRQIRRAEMNAASTQFSVPRMAIVNDRNLAELMTKATHSPDEIDQVDQLQLDMWLGEQMNAMFHAWDRSHSGSFEKEFWETTTRPGLAQILTVAAASKWWDQNRHGFMTEFRAEVDRVREDLG